MKTKKQKLEKLAKLLHQAAVIADELEVKLGNGGEVGSIVMGCAFEVEQLISFV